MEVGEPIALDLSLEDAKLELDECIKELDEWNEKFLAYSDSILCDERKYSGGDCANRN